MRVSLAFVLASLAVPASCFAGSPDHTYRFYMYGVEKGLASTGQDSNGLVLESVPGFGPSYEARITISAGKPTAAELIVSGKNPVSYSIAADGTVSAAGKPIARAPLFAPTLPALIPSVLNEYDLRKGGDQKLLTVDMAKGLPRTLVVQLFRTEERLLNGKPIKLREWRVDASPTPDTVLWTDEGNVPLYWWTPKLNYELVRNDSAELRVSYKYKDSVSPARFSVTSEKAVWVPMRDGVKLLADVYRPEAPGRFPVILQRSPYDRNEFGTADGEYYAQRGYVYVTENVRGRGGSEGPFEPLVHEGPDGYDTVQWCGSQPWSNGRVGMIGASYNGYCCWMAAKTRPSALKTIVPVVPMTGPPYGAFWDRGAYHIQDSLGWFGLLRDPKTVQLYAADVTKAMNSLPISKADQLQFGHPVLGFQEQFADTYDSGVKRGSYRFELGKVDLPVLYLDGWLDPISIATALNYTAMKKLGRKNQKLIWGPWDHFTNQESKMDRFDFGPDGYIDMRTTCLRWFDRWLKGMPNGIDKEPAVDEFVLGENRWHKAADWPPKNAKAQKWYLSGADRLVLNRPRSQKPSAYTYDPASYVFTNAANASYLELVGDDAAALCRHKGQLIFDSPPLKKPITLDGPIIGTLYASTSAKDTDWAMAVIDRHPDGVCVPLTAGFVRARFRKSYTNPKLLKGGEVLRYGIDLWQTCVRIPAGHKLRIVVCSTLFPDVDRNLNSGEIPANATKIVVASQKVFHDAKHPSYVELPVVRGALG